ncbi:uncharacterized protein LOC111471538 isoform X3 [Cucurbita maxima]|uniref:Uncharacterized protein LOC111471538 isoform X3 n=1 Tax=Cucurbita maxima TaxID=3661 RepID=A0A6J1IBU3_CUCMA|nr:uncharacterized protein LOC111471538 isoform X3 [Cucurbita maxima]
MDIRSGVRRGMMRERLIGGMGEATMSLVFLPKSQKRWWIRRAREGTRVWDFTGMAKNTRRVVERAREGTGSQAERRVGMVEGKGKGKGRGRGRGRRIGKVEKEEVTGGLQVKISVLKNKWKRTQTHIFRQSCLENVLHSPGLENHLEIRVRKRTGSFDGDKHKDDIGDVDNRQLSSKNDTVKDGRRKSEKYKDERNREKYREDVDRDGKERHEQLVKDHISRSNDRDLRDEKDAMDMHHKRNKPQDSDPDREVTKAKREGDIDAMRDQDHDRHHAYERDHEQESRRRRDRGRDRDRDRDRDSRRHRSRSRARDRYSDYECDVDRDGYHFDDQYTKYVDSRGRKRSPNDHDDSVDARSKSLKNSHHANDEKKSLSNDKVDSDAERGRSQSRSRHGDVSLSSHRRKSSPSSHSRVVTDEYRHQDQEDLRDRYPKKEDRSKSISTRDKGVLSVVQEKGSKYTYSEKPSEIEGGNATEMLRDRTLNSKNVDIEESGRRHNNSIDAKDLSSNKDRHSWDIQGEKPVMDDSSQVESYYSKGSQSNPSPFHPRPAFRGGVDIPFDGSLDDDGRLNSNSHFRRGNDPNMGRVHGNTWRGVPNWTAPLPNGFIPFQHGPPPHGSFQSLMPQFPAPPMFGIRPPLDINHSGIHYRMPDADRFSSHMHPLGWQNMLDGSSPSHLHGWDANNGIFRDESHIYNGAEWDENRQMVNGRGWDSKAEMWKRQSGSLKREIPSQFQKDERLVQDPVDDVSSKEICDENADTVLTKTAEIRPNIPSAKESPNTPELLSETPAPLSRSMDDNSKLSCSYLSKLKISTELALPDLYQQCQRLMDIEHCATADEETAAYIVLEGGMRAVSVSSNSAQISLFRPNKNSVFQHAMDLYKKQRTEMKEMQAISREMPFSERMLVEEQGMQVVSGGMAFSERKHEEKGFNFNNEEVKAPVSTVDAEMTQAPIKTTGVDKAIEADAALGKLEDLAVEADAALGELEDLAVEADSALGELEDLASPATREVKCLENSEESVPTTNSTEVVMMDSEQQANLDAEKDTIVIANDNTPVNNINESSNDDDMKGIVNGKDSPRCDELSNNNDIKGIVNGKESPGCGVGNSCFDKAVSGPLSFAGGDEIGGESCEEGGLMGGGGGGGGVPIGSESLILSQIRHSPESTH